MPLITPDAHCPTFPRMGSLPDSLALHQWLKKVCSWSSSRRPLDALEAASGTEKYLVIILSEHSWDTAKQAHGAQIQVAAASLELLESLCQTGRPQRFPHGKVDARSGILGWAHTCHSSTMVCWGTLLWGGFRAALWLGSGWKPSQRIIFSLSTWLNIPYSILLLVFL